MGMVEWRPAGWCAGLAWPRERPGTTRLLSCTSLLQDVSSPLPPLAAKSA